MAKKEVDIKEFTNKMIENLNEKLGGKNKKVVFNLQLDKEDPAKIVRWYSTHSLCLDWICGAENKGLPGGRLIEIYGPESIGKSHLCYQCARWVQEQGGICLYIDTELATSVPNLTALGIDIGERFIYAKVDSIEESFEVIEEFLKEVATFGNKVPIGIFWDSIGGIGSRLERDMSFDDVQRPGLNAKQITFGLRKIMPAINQSAALFILVNQEYDVLNAMRFDAKKKETKGGKMIKYAASVRMGIEKVTNVYPNDADKKKAYTDGLSACGIRVRARTYKNKVAAPDRAIEFDIHFGVGLKEHMTIWTMLAKEKQMEVDGKIYEFGNTTKKTITVLDAKTGEELEKISFAIKEIEEVLMKTHRNITEACFNKLMSRLMQRDNNELSADLALNNNLFTEEEAYSDLGE